ncbi:MAG: hypothetical protein U9N44_02980 [Chloroflexota bacterium]|nr:hypothetical protein [Chloroflexota bacterium]
MNEPELYSEAVPFKLARPIVGVFVVLSLMFLGMFIYQMEGGSLGGKPAPDWYYLVMFVVFVAFTLLMFNFDKLKILVTFSSITVGYGRFKRVMSWEDISDCYADESSVFSYGGYGIRTGRVNGKSRLVYNVLGGERVVLALKKGRFNEFVFSTNDPDAVMNVIKQRIRE